MTIPTPLSFIAVKEVSAHLDEMLRYCIATVLENADIGAMSYSQEHDEVTYHLKITDVERELFPALGATDDIWIITKARRES